MFTPSELANTSSPTACCRRERLLLERDRRDAVDGERPDGLVLGHVRQQVQAALRERQPVRVDEVVLDPPARHRVIAHRRDAEVQRRLEQPRDDVRRRLAPPRARGPGLATSTDGSRSRNCRIRGDSIFSSRANALVRSRWNGVPATASSRLRLRYSAHSSGSVKPVSSPFSTWPSSRQRDAAVVVALVVEREAGFLQRREIAADRARGDVELVGQRVDRGAVPRRFERVQQLPLADDFLVARHGRILSLGLATGPACSRSL